MDIRSLHVNNSNPGLLVSHSSLRNSLAEKPFSCNIMKMGFPRLEDFRNPSDGSFRIVSKKLKFYSVDRSLVVRATGDKNHNNLSSSGNGDQSIPEGDGSDGRNPVPDNNSGDSTVHESYHSTNLDWRTVRANFVARKKVLLVDTESPVQDGVSCESSKPVGQKWAHPIHEPETGCILVATDKLDGVRTFERTVVFLLRSGNEHPREGPFGVVINRPLQKKVKDMKPTNRDLATTFADCPLHFGGPLEASMFLLNTGESLQIPGFEEVIPGLCFGARNRLDEAAGLVKKEILRPLNFRFFVGYAGWQMDQLKEEIESGYWFLAACSTDLIHGGSSSSSSEGLWKEILQLMGGHYAEVSRKPKQNS